MMEIFQQEQRHREYWRRYPQLVIALFIVVMGVRTVPSMAEEHPIDDSGEEPGFFTTILNKVDQQQDSLSQNVVGFSEKIDTLFVDEEQDRRLNHSYVQLGYRYTFYDKSPTLREPVVDVHIHLPRVDSLFRFEISSESNNDAAVSSKNKSNSENDGSMGEGRKDDRNHLFKTKLTGGFKFVESQFTGYLNLRVERKFLFDQWSLLLSEDLYKDSVVKRLAKSQMQFERGVSDNKVLRLTTLNSQYFDHRYRLNDQIFHLRHQLARRDLLIYQLGATWRRDFAEEQYQLNNYYVALRYQRKLHQDWLYFEATSQVDFSREDDFSATPQLMMQLTAILGNKVDDW